LVFDNGPRVPQLWLDRYGRLVQNVAFFFLHPDGSLETLRDD
jgi:hypothetical protein